MKRIPRVVCSVVVTLLLLVSASLIGSAQQDDARTTITFSFWGTPVEHEMWQAIVDRFNELHSHIHVQALPTSDYENKLLTMIAGGVAPDVMNIEEEPYLSFVEADAFLDLTERFERDLRAEDYNPVALRFQSVNGRYYALPWDIGIGVIFHNLTLHNELGLAPPAMDLTWPTFIESARRMTRDLNGDGQPDQWGFHVASGFRGTSIYSVWGSGGDLVDDPANPTRATLSEPEGIRGLQLLHDLIHVYEVVPPNLSTPSFPNGNLGMHRNGTWAFVTFREQITDFEWDITFFPKHPDVSHSGGYLGPDNIAISKTTNHPDEAWEFVKFVIGPEGQRMIGEYGRAIPSHIESARNYFLDPTKPPSNAQALIEGVEAYGRLVPRIANFRRMEQEWQVENVAMLRGQQTPEATAARIDEITERYLRGDQ